MLPRDSVSCVFHWVTLSGEDGVSGKQGIPQEARDADAAVFSDNL